MNGHHIAYAWLMRDQLDLDRDKIPVGFPFILNLDITGNPGTHWVMFMRITRQTMFYYDSFGRPPPDELIKLCDRYDWTLKYIDIQIQDDSSTACGYFTVYMIILLKDNKNLDSINKKLLSTFSQSDLSNNDSIVYQLV